MGVMDYLQAYLPKTEGLLPKWLLIVTVMAVFNTVQNFTTIKLTRRLYNATPNGEHDA
ncbi:hypothetical protein EIP86_007810 [Pleurotus ostreatoroseus]|nr:hypothetical protein EIP86_007810 [Pleurotus ostreatoroseus]